MLHIAPKNGFETSEALLKALKLRNERHKIAAITHTDKEGTRYTPQNYIRVLLSADNRTKMALLDCLLQNNGAKGVFVTRE